MSWVVPLALLALALAIVSIVTMTTSRKKQREQVQPRMKTGPTVLVHDINDDRCTGCDACVAVCPTNVLDLVNNKSRVLRFEDCIQCEACMVACPTEALVMFPEGTEPPPLKVPEMDEFYQTAVPGQYLIGEVSGKPLVKNAANLGRAVIEHMLLTGLAPGALGRGTTDLRYVDVAIVGSGPGGLSAALSCIQRGLSYVVLEKEQLIASTISRYPKGKLVMAEPYDTANLSLLPVFDSSKEELIPIWQQVIDRVGLKIALGESVESIEKQADGTFVVASTVSRYRAQRVVLSIGTRGKPRTLQVQGENLPKVFSLLEDPDLWRGKSVLVVGGGDSAVEAAMALADAGAMVIHSYRGKSFNRCAPKNKQAIEQYAGEGRLKLKLGSQVLMFDQEAVTMALGDGTQKRYANDAAFVLIGADPPVQWLQKVGVQFVQRQHQYQLGKTDEFVLRMTPTAVDCPEDAARAAAQVLGGSIGGEASGSAPSPGMGGHAESGPRKWLRSATSIFSSRSKTDMSFMAALPKADAGKSGAKPAPAKPAPVKAPPPPMTRDGRKLDGPVPLSEFARQQRTSSGQSGLHSGHGRRDALSAGERTRILRMLRDEGGRLADEDDDSNVYIGQVPPRTVDFDFDDSPAPAPVPVSRPIAGATSLGGGIRSKPSDATHIGEMPERLPPMPQMAAPPARPKPPTAAPPSGVGAPRVAAPVVPASAPVARPSQGAPSADSASARPSRGPMAPPPARPVPAPSTSTSDQASNQGNAARPSQPATGARPARRSVPPPFAAEQTKQVPNDIVAAVRRNVVTATPDESTRMTDLATFDGPTTFDPNASSRASAPLAAPRHIAAGGAAKRPPPNMLQSNDGDEDEMTHIASSPSRSDDRTDVGVKRPSGVDWDID